MKITDIEIIPIHPRLAKRYDNAAGRVGLLRLARLVIKVHTDAGIIGYGDGDWPGPPPPYSEVEPLIGRSPFDFMHADFNLTLSSALYDAMGKYLDVPVYKLLGQKLRDAGMVAAWTRPCPADIFAGEIERAVSEGYTIFKMHTKALYDPIEQAEAAAKVAPDNFRIHFDFNGGGRTVGALLPLVAELEKNHPIVGFIEDPLPRTDIEGWRTLRQNTTIPIVHGGQPLLGGMQEIMHGVADIYMLGGRTIGRILPQGIACGLANIQTILQLTGGTLMKAMTLHMAAVLPTATGHSINLDDQYEEDITTERIPVVEGFSNVPEGPGLGFEVDEGMLAKVAANDILVPGRTVGILHMPNGHKIYTSPRPSVQSLTGREEGAIRGINFEKWEDDGTPEFEGAYEKMKAEAEARGEMVE